MIDSREAVRRPVNAPLRRHSRRRWAIAAGVAACWLVADAVTGSILTATVLLIVVGGLGWATVAGLRAMGIPLDHPWLQRMVARPWRDGQAVLGVALRHLPEVFVVTPSGSLIAPDIVELQLNPRDLASLRTWMDLDIISANVTEAYQDQVARRGARFVGSHRPEVYITADDSLPEGRYRLRRGLPQGARYAADPYDRPDGPDSSDYQHGYDVAQEYAVTTADPVGAGADDRGPYPVNPSSRTIMDGRPTVMEQIRPAVPVLRLVTGSLVAETSMSGARAGRGVVELELPDVPTVSRVHATFTYAMDRWWVTNKGVNGLSVNGTQVSGKGKRALSDGDSIRWGMSQDAPVSRVEIG